MATKEKFNFMTPLHLACGKDDFRPILQYVFFIEGWVYASNSMVLIKQSLDDYCQVIDKEKLNGHALHADSFKNILRYDTVWAFDDYVKACKGDGTEVIFPYAKEGITAPNFKKILEDRINPTLVDGDNSSEASMGNIIGLNPYYIEIVGKVLYSGTNYTPLRLTVGKKGQAIIAEPVLIADYPNQVALIMPILTDVD